MRKLYCWYKGLSNQMKSSIRISALVISAISVVLTILGVSLGSIQGLSILIRFCIIVALFVVLALTIYCIIGAIFKESIDLTIRGTRVRLRYGDIFKVSSLRVIGCDNCFDTCVDDVIISKKSLHGQFVTQHGDADEINTLIELEAQKQGILKNQEGKYKFPIGTIIQYESKVDNCVYLMLAMNELDAENKAYTNMAKYEQMLMKMWEEIDRVYAMRDVAIPVLGDGITRFYDGPQGKENLLKCMLCTLNSSSVALKSTIEILIFDNEENLSLYEFRNAFHSIPRKEVF